MKNIAIVSFTRNTVELSEEIVKLLGRHKYICTLHNANRGACEVELITALKSTKSWVDECWKRMDAFVFIGSANVATRMFADLVEDKMKDPAVLVLDEECKYVIPILGNHIGLGNDLASKLAKLVNAKDILTTTEEVNEKFTIEKFAERNEMEIGNRDQARTITAAILEGQHIGFYCENDIDGEIPPGLTPCKDTKELSWFIQRISIRSEYVVGMGLKEGVSFVNVEDLFLAQLDVLNIDMIQVKGIATIRDKKEEPALISLAEKYHLPILSFTGKELRDLHVVSSEDPSAKNEANISERAAILGSDCGQLIQKKVVGRGATFAAAKKLKTIYFD